MSFDDEDVLTERERAQRRALGAFLGRCIECGAEIEPALARLGATTCSLHRRQH